MVQIMNIIHACDRRETSFIWPYVYMLGRLRDDHSAKYGDCDCHGFWTCDTQMPSSPGTYKALYEGKDVLIVLAFKCPAMLSGRLAYADDEVYVEQVKDPNKWVSQAPISHGT